MHNLSLFFYYQLFFFTNILHFYTYILTWEDIKKLPLRRTSRIATVRHCADCRLVITEKNMTPKRNFRLFSTITKNRLN